MKKLRYGLIPALGLLSLQAMAELPAEVTTSLADAKSDALVVAGLIVGIVASIFAFKIIRGLLR